MSSSGPTIPAEEFADRGQRLRKAMERAEVDVFLAYSDDRATYGQQHARYLFNYQPHFEPALLVIPLEGDAFIATGPESVAFVEATSTCRDARAVDAFTHPHEEYPHSKVHKLAGLLSDIRVGARQARRVALAGGEAMPFHVWQILQSAGTEIVDGEKIILGLRALKSTAEIAVIRHAYAIAEAGMAAGLNAVRPGITEREIAAEAEYAMRRRGSEGMGIDMIVGAGRANTYAILTRTTHRSVRHGDHVLLTIAPRYEGYHGALGRVAAVGDIDPAIETAAAVAIEAQDAAAELLRPGMIGAELDRRARGVCRAADLEKHFAYSGIHSVGVVEFEPPILTSWSAEVLKPDMVFSIDIPIFFAPWGGLRIEDGFVIRAEGEAERLQALSREITYVA